MKTSPTQRSLKFLRDQGYTCQVVERWNVYAKIRQDLFGFIDIVALTPEGIVGVQTTSTANMSARKKKILENPFLAPWLGAGGGVHIHGWAKRGERGKRKTWTLKQEVLAEVSEPINPRKRKAVPETIQGPVQTRARPRPKTIPVRSPNSGQTLLVLPPTDPT